MLDPFDRVDPAIVLPTSEKDFQEQVIRLARDVGFTLIYHTFDARRSHAGFPDLVLVKPPRILFVELKKDAKAKVSMDQKVWLETLGQCPGVEVYLWTPDDFDEAGRILSA